VSRAHIHSFLYSRISLGAAIVVILVGGGALLGWLTMHPFWVQWDHHLAPMPFNAAIALILIGVSAIFLHRRYFGLALLCVLPVIFFSMAAGVSFLIGVDLGVNHPLFWNRPPFFAHRVVRLAPLSVLMFAVASLATAFAALRRARAIGPSTGALLMAFGAAGLVGQLAPLWPIWRSLHAVSFPGSFAFFVLGVAALSRGWAEMRARRFGLAFLTATVLLTMAVVLAAALNTYEQDELQRNTQAVWQGVADQMREQTHRPLAIARTAARWGKFGMPPKAQAKSEASLLLKEVPGLQAVIAVAPSSQVQWRVPAVGSGGVTGRFLNSDPQRALALRRARATGRVVMTSLIPLFKGGQGFVVAAPIESAHGFQGYLAGIFDTSGFFSQVVTNLWQGFHVTVMIHHQEFFARGRPGDPRYRHVGHVHFLGQVLTMAVSPGSRFVKKIDVGLPAIVLASGFLLALFAAAAVYAMQQAQKHAFSLDRLNAGLENLVLARTAALREERERWRVTLMSIGDGVIVTDSEGLVLALNTEAERLTGYWDEEARGLALDVVFPLYQDTEGPVIEGLVAQVLRTGTVSHRKGGAILKVRDGRVLRVSDSAAPIRNEDGDVTGAVMVFRDITQQQALEEQAMKAKSLESLGILAGGIAHDFNNILTAIFGNITLAKIYAPTGERLQDALKDAERASWRARELTLQLLTFAKGGAPVKKPGSIGDTVKDLTAFFVKGSAVRCEVEIRTDLWPTEFDPDQMGQVIQNIVLNAKEAMGGAGILQVVATNVVVGPSEIVDLAAGEYVKIAFRDSGRGIEQQYLDRIFDPYFSLKPTGTGLGLAVTYSVVKRHQGVVVADSVLGQGTTLTLYLPRSGIRRGVTMPEGRVSPIIAASGRGRRILLMDDDADVRVIGARLLRVLGFDVAEVGTGEEAVTLYEQAQEARNPFEVVILDLTVPGAMGGKECVRRLKKCNPEVRAIVATGYYTDPIVAEFQTYGFVAAVQKPYRLEDLSTALTKVLGP